MSRKIIQSLLDKQMTRKEFLHYLSGMMLGAFGIYEFLTHLFSVTQPQVKSSQNDRHGFGGGKFGI